MKFITSTISRQSVNIDFFIVGAKARDILAKNAGLKESPRKTSDVDFAVLVDSWATLEKLRQSFVSDGNIEESSDKNNKVRYKFKGTPLERCLLKRVNQSGKCNMYRLRNLIIKIQKQNFPRRNGIFQQSDGMLWVLSIHES